MNFEKRSLLIPIAVTLLLPSNAAADTCDSSTYDGQHFFFNICNVPDFDQKRAAFGTIKGLPNNGNMYCAPASALNWSAYIANHGYPSVSPGPSNWELSPPTYLNEYNFITDNLAFMGGAMNTTPTGGTGGKGAVEGLQAWLDTFSPANFIVVGVFAKDDWSPRAKDASLLAMWGGLVNLGIGWYTNADQPKAHVRNGGHAVSLVGGNNTKDPVGSTSGGLLLNDPARTPDNNLLTQSTFQYEGTAFQSETQYFCGKDKNGFVAGCVVRTQDRLTYTGSGYMDAYIAVIPKYGLSYDSVQLILLKAVQLAGREQRTVQRFTPPLAGRIVDAALNPTRITHPYLIEGSDAIWQLDALTGRSSQFARVPQGPVRLTWGADEKLYVLTGRQLECFNRNGLRTRNIGLQSPLDAIAYDEKHQILVGLSRSAGRLYLFDPSLSRAGSIPAPASVLGATGRLTVRINPANGEMWSLSEGARSMSRFEFSATGALRSEQVSLPPEIGAAQGFDVDEKGNLFITSGGTVYPMDGSGRLLRASRFFGLEAGVGIQVLRPYSNFDPAVHDTPAWINVLPEDAVR